MAVHVSLEHGTTYRFDRLVGLGPHVIRLRPAPHCRTPIESYSLTITPAEHFINWQQDPYGNYLARVVFPERTTELSITVDLIADMAVINPFDFFVEDYAETYPVRLPAGPRRRPRALPPCRADGAARCSPTGSRPDRLAATAERTVDFLVGLNRRVAATIGYTVRMEPGVQTPDETLRRGIGSCRDIGLAAGADAARARPRGALRLRLPDPARAPTSTRSTGRPDRADFTDLHAWAEVYLPGAGWVGLDATSGLFAGEGHIPLVGHAEPGRVRADHRRWSTRATTTMEFHNVVRRFREDPRITLPVHRGPVDGRPGARATQVDARLDGRRRAADHGRRADLRLDRRPRRRPSGTSPPTAPTSGEWPPSCSPAAASGTTRRGGVLHHGQGKWYPGEPLPRWPIALTGAPTASRSGTTRRCSPIRGPSRTVAATPDQAAAGRLRHRATARHHRRLRAAAPTRTRWPGWPTRRGCPTANRPALDPDAGELGASATRGPRSSPSLDAGITDAAGWVAPAAPSRGRRRLGHRPLAASGAAGWSWCPGLAGRPAAAAGLARLDAARPAAPRPRPFAVADDRCRCRDRATAPESRDRSRRSRTRPPPRCAVEARDGHALRLPAAARASSRTPSSWSPPSRTAAAAVGCRSCSRAIRRPAIRAPAR